jgi:hypothetical protein|tara:strand:+ start:319 stop:1365 length:1047 start_codon:yes stop_codon:yes gene_type:complete
MKEKIIELLNGGQSELESFITRYFNDDKYNFLEVLSKLGLLDEGSNETLLELFPMSYLKYKYRNNKLKTIDEIVGQYSDIKKVGDKYILILNTMSDLSIFFKDDDNGRDMSSSEMVKNILGEDWFEPFNDVTSNLYTDVIEELTEKNKFLVAKSLSTDLSGELISPETELLENIAKDQGHPDYVDVKDPLLVMDILEEDESSSKVLLDESSEVASNLYNLHHNSYNTAYVDERYNEVMSEIKHLLEIDNSGDWVSKEIKNSEGVKVIYDYTIDVTKFIPYLFSSIFNDEYQDDDYRNVFEHWGDFEDLTKEMINEDVIEGSSLDNRYHDYADSDMVRKNLNDFIVDYV